MITRNDIFNYISSLVKAEFGESTFVVGERVNVPSKFPCVSAIEVGNVPVTMYETLDGTDDQRQSTFEVQVYSNLKTGATRQVEAIIDYITLKMQQIGYRAILSEPLDNVADTSIKRHVARYSRVIGGSDTLPQTD